MKLNNNAKSEPKYTHEGARAALHVSAENQLRRSVLSCLLWEREAYEDGEEIATRIQKLAKDVDHKVLANLAIEARSIHHLRHVPLLLLSVLSDIHKGDSLVPDTIERTIQRADELTELLAIHAKVHGVGPDKLKKIMSHGMVKGLAKAFGKFSAYNLAKYNRDGVVKLRDVLFLTHAKPKDAEQKEVWGKLIDGSLESPDTWEVELSAGKDKKLTFERLLKEGKLGYLALLRNLRNMVESGVDEGLVKASILARLNGADRVLPFRYIAASRAAPRYERELDQALIASLDQLPKLEGKTVVLVDVSSSMDDKLSQKSDLTRADAAAALASIIDGNVQVFSFSNDVIEVPPRKGMAGVDAILKSQRHGGTELFKAVDYINANFRYDRIIVITDEQATGQLRSTYNLGKGTLADPKGKAYMINVASARNGVGYGKWLHLDGFSENVIRFIHEFESVNNK